MKSHFQALAGTAERRPFFLVGHLINRSGMSWRLKRSPFTSNGPNTSGVHLSGIADFRTSWNIVGTRLHTFRPSGLKPLPRIHSLEVLRTQTCAGIQRYACLSARIRSDSDRRRRRGGLPRAMGRTFWGLHPKGSLVIRDTYRFNQGSGVSTSSPEGLRRIPPMKETSRPRTDTGQHPPV